MQRLSSHLQISRSDDVVGECDQRPAKESKNGAADASNGAEYIEGVERSSYARNDRVRGIDHGVQYDIEEDCDWSENVEYKGHQDEERSGERNDDS